MHNSLFFFFSLFFLGQEVQYCFPNVISWPCHQVVQPGTAVAQSQDHKFKNNLLHLLFPFDFAQDTQPCREVSSTEFDQGACQGPNFQLEGIPVLDIPWSLQRVASVLGLRIMKWSHPHHCSLVTIHSTAFTMCVPSSLANLNHWGLGGACRRTSYWDESEFRTLLQELSLNKEGRSYHSHFPWATPATS